MTPAQIAHELGGHRIAGGFLVRCPAHDDRNPSCSITEHSGKLLVHCHAGCDQHSIISALRDRGLWPKSERRGYPADWGEIAATYPYTDEDGKLLFEVCRFIPKSFRPRRPDGRWTLSGVRRVLYRLPEVSETAILFVVEGEKDVETLREHGFVATCNPGGAGKWRPEYSEFLRGRECILIPDQDAAGLAHAAQVARALMGVAQDLRLIELPEKYKDISAWFAAGHSEVELITILEGVDHV